MIRKFFPSEQVDSVFNIDFEKMYELGYNAIIFDIDNTLVPHGAPATRKIASLFETLRKIGFKTCLISNNDSERVIPFARKVKSPAIFDAHKPSIDGYIKSIYKMKSTLDKTFFVGDQLFTDIFGANNAGIYSILVSPIHPKEEIQIRFKRILEQPILKLYKNQR